MYDLIDESGKDFLGFGYKVTKDKKFPLTYSSLSIKNKEESKKLDMDEGEYFIINCPSLYYEGYDLDLKIEDKLHEKMLQFLKILKLNNNSKVLIVGLGNPDIACDSLGKVVFDRVTIDVTQKENHVYKFCPNIYFSTGIESIDMIKAFVSQVKVDYIIVIDSLATRSLARLGCSIQLTTTGITPGSAVNRFGTKIDSKKIGLPCISIGVPFMIFAKHILSDAPDDLILAPKDIRDNIARVGLIIAESINKTLYKR